MLKFTDLQRWPRFAAKVASKRNCGNKMADRGIVFVRQLSFSTSVVSPVPDHDGIAYFVFAPASFALTR